MIGAARRARRAYLRSPDRRFGLLVDVGEVIALLECDRLDEVQELTGRVVAAAVPGGQLEPLGRDVRVLFSAGIAGRRGDFGAYLDQVQPVMASLEARGDRAPYALAARYVARACTALGRLDEAESYLRRATGVGAQPGMSAVLSLIERDWIALEIARGDLGAARARAREGIERAPDNPYLAIEAWALRASADAALPRACQVNPATAAYAELRGAERALEQRDGETALAHARAAERWYQAAGLNYETVRAQLAGAEAQLQLGAHEACREALQRCTSAARQSGYRPALVTAALVAAARADRAGDLGAYVRALETARAHAGPGLADEALARACARVGIDATGRAPIQPFRAAVDRLGLARGATHLVRAGARRFLLASDEPAPVPCDLLIDLADRGLVAAGRRHRCADLRLRLLERLALGGDDGASMEALYLDVWGGNEFDPLRHRNSIYVALQRTRVALEGLLGPDAIESIGDARYRLAPRFAVATRHVWDGSASTLARAGVGCLPSTALARR